jgi:hypothetical protein
VRVFGILSIFIFYCLHDVCLFALSINFYRSSFRLSIGVARLTTGT